MSQEAAVKKQPEPVAVNREQVIEALKNVYDPEIPVDIYELGLIYDIRIDEQNNVDIDMTMTAPSCPAAQSLPMQVEWQVSGIEGVNQARVEVVWEPPWTPDMMSEEARLQLGYF
jgi:FeS assembly SUF system protein